MEILLEALLQIAGWALQVAAEILLQLFGELVLEGFLRSLSAPFERARAAPPWMAAIGYLTYGALAGAASLWPVPAHFIATPWLRAANLLVAPGSFFHAGGKAFQLFLEFAQRRLHDHGLQRDCRRV